MQLSLPAPVRSGWQTIDQDEPCEACKLIHALSDVPFNKAVTIAVWSLETAPALAVKLAAVEPAGTITDGGTVSAAALLDSATATPPAPAELDSVTVHVEVPPAARLVGVQDKEPTKTGATSDIVICELPLYEAVTTAIWFVVNVPAVAIKFASVAPAATFTVAGTVSAAALLDSVTVIPPELAACDRVTVQAAVAPGVRLAGLQDTWLTLVGATSSSDAVCELPL